MNERFENYSIELDCPPGNPRPGDLITGVLKDTGLEVSDFDTTAPFFGHQTWVLKADAGKDKLFETARRKFRQRITSLYNHGQIRYGTW